MGQNWDKSLEILLFAFTDAEALRYVGYDYRKTWRMIRNPVTLLKISKFSKNYFQYFQTPQSGLFIMGYRLQHSFNPALRKIAVLNHTFICFPLDGVLVNNFLQMRVQKNRQHPQLG